VAHSNNSKKDATRDGPARTPVVGDSSTSRDLNVREMASLAVPRRRKSRKRGRPSGDEIEHRKYDILAAARIIFARNGYADTTVNEIAQAAGVGKKTIYSHIGDKAELFRVTFGTPAVKEGEKLFELPSGGLTTREVLQSLARRVLEHALSPAHLALERALVMESARFPKLVREVIGSSKAFYRRQLSVAFEEMVTRRLLPPSDTCRAAAYFFDVIAASDAFKAVLGYLDEPIDAAELDKRIDLFMYGYIGPKSSIMASRKH
jgi:TetR/AcrR family transcriptional regulator, regulator of autoinduction and epiphytic fitness